MPTKVQIASKALVLLGQAPVSTLDDVSSKSQTINGLYSITKPAFLSASYWKFALREQSLSQLAGGGSKFRSGYEFAYQLPTDALRPIGFPADYADFQVAGNELYTNSNEASLLYVADVDESWFPAWFADALAYQLAMEASLGVSDDDSRLQLLTPKAAQKKAEAMGIDATTQSHWDLALGRILLRHPTPRF